MKYQAKLGDDPLQEGVALISPFSPSPKKYYWKNLFRNPLWRFPGLTLSYSQGDRLPHPILITVFYGSIFAPFVNGGLITRLVCKLI